MAQRMSDAAFPKVSDSIQERREHIIQAATHIIAQEGLAALSVRTVAERANCSRGLVVHYFGNKKALLVASNDWTNETYLQRVNTAVGDRKGLAALELRLRNLLPYTEAILDEWTVRIAFWHQGRTIPSLEQSNNLSFYAIYKEILADMRMAQANGEIAATIPVQVTSEMLLFVVIGICTSCLSNARLRQQAPLDRRMAMMMGFLATGDVAALEVGDPAKDY